MLYNVALVRRDVLHLSMVLCTQILLVLALILLVRAMFCVHGSHLHAHASKDILLWIIDSDMASYDSSIKY